MLGQNGYFQDTFEQLASLQESLFRVRHAVKFAVTKGGDSQSQEFG